MTTIGKIAVAALVLLGYLLVCLALGAGNGDDNRAMQEREQRRLLDYKRRRGCLGVRCGVCSELCPEGHARQRLGKGKGKKEDKKDNRQ